ncbi:hypothetical protein J7I98_39020 [Streptomyces sp. ISL-98]|uniref:hypothetical protein n=1 Tax=Streptomyces sp. ISL-98 TaxID=2819192 RepID=UPI001BE650CC|nr:hypothetical protein [Streptomyces sp. ISL-98]MBT2511671.1 hypothetical protein [Streptomyces sp. ISL-98]
MPVPLMGMLLLLSVATAGAGIVTVFLLLNNPPQPLSKFCAVLVLIFSSSAAAVYCYGWYSVTMGGPFPELCEDRNASGAELASMKQEYWPLRNACIYSDGPTVEYVSMTINVLVCVLASLAVVLTGAAAFLRWRARQSSEKSVVHLA